MEMQAELARQTREAVLGYLYDRYPEPVADQTLIGLLSDRPDLSATVDTIRRAMDYLEDTALVLLTRREEQWLAQLTAIGVDEVEATPAMGNEVVQNRYLRLKILEVLSYDTRPKSEGLIQAALSRVRDLNTSSRAIHRACSYLVQIGLAEWQDRAVLRIRAAGTDYLYGEGPDHWGVLRPVRL